MQGIVIVMLNLLNISMKRSLCRQLNIVLLQWFNQNLEEWSQSDACELGF